MAKDVPIYRVIYNDIINNINDNAYYNGKLPSEAQLCKMYDVSRMTVNKALSFLAQEGYIYRFRGRGSFVKSHEVSKTIEESKSFTEDIRRRGGKPGSLVILLKSVKSTTVPQIAEWLKVPREESLFYFVRVRTADEKPIAISQTYLSKAIVPKLPVTSLETSLYSYLRDELNIFPRCSNFILQAKLPSSWEKKILNSQNEALLTVTHLSYTEQGEPFEYNITSYLGSKYLYVTNQALEPLAAGNTYNFSEPEELALPMETNRLES